MVLGETFHEAQGSFRPLLPACVIPFVKTKNPDCQSLGMMIRVVLVGWPVYRIPWSVKLHCSTFVVTAFLNLSSPGAMCSDSKHSSTKYADTVNFSFHIVENGTVKIMRSIFP